MTISNEHQQDHKHHRYYIFSHVDGDSIHYACFPHGSKKVEWDKDFYAAKIFSHEASAIHHANILVGELDAHFMDHIERRVVIGRVKVEVDPQFDMKVVK